MYHFLVTTCAKLRAIRFIARRHLQQIPRCTREMTEAGWQLQSCARRFTPNAKAIDQVCIGHVD